MQQTNYYIFDWMDFDSDFSKDESLWKAYEPTAVNEADGDILVTVPYQKQVLQEDMLADTNVPQRDYTLRLRAYGDAVVRVFTSMAGDEMSDESHILDIHPDMKKMPLNVRQCDGIYTITDAKGATRAIIDTTPYKTEWWSDLQPAPQPTIRLTVYPDGNLAKGVELSDDHFSPPRYDALPIAFCLTEGKPDRATMSFRCEAGECFAGTGERFRKMDLSGQTFYLKNQDGQGVNNRRAYKNIPFYMSSRMYGVFYHTYDYCRLSLADHSTRSVQFRNDRATIDAFVIGGGAPERILFHYRQLTGFPPMLPLWSFGIWMSRMTYFSADEVEGICRRLRDEHYPCDVIHLDTGWFRTDWLCEWKFNPERFPNPEAFIKRLADNGFKVSLWQLPYVAEGAEQIAEAKANRYIGPLLHEQASEGSNFSTLDYAGTIDFTYDKATEWYKSLLRELLEMGVKCIKTDFGENIHLDATYHSMSPRQLNNIYALLYQKAAFEVTKDVTGDGIVWARAAWAGCQRYPLHWGGDSESSWAGMAGSLKGGLHFGLSGFAFWSHDVPGFHSEPDFMNSPIDPKVYVRWTQFGVFSSHMRYHGSHKREPWFYPSVADIVKKWWRIRYWLIPYIIEESEAATTSGYPVIQAMLMHHPEDMTCWHIDDQYYFGRKLLVAPVMNSDDKRDIYLPEGEWVDIFSGERFQGPTWLKKKDVPLDTMPVFCRPGTEISVYEPEVESTDDIDFSKVTKKTFI
ncbi:MAG: alpha-xylosidase [Prevotella sp.]|nr:alpha-xylosidase [Prevotella sp.]